MILDLRAPRKAAGHYPRGKPKFPGEVVRCKDDDRSGRHTYCWGGADGTWLRFEVEPEHYDADRFLALLTPSGFIYNPFPVTFQQKMTRKYGERE